MLSWNNQDEKLLAKSRLDAKSDCDEPEALADMVPPKAGYLHHLVQYDFRCLLSIRDDVKLALTTIHSSKFSLLAP